jgi:hypothetical protein
MSLSKSKAAWAALFLCGLLVVGYAAPADDHKSAHPNDPVKQEEHFALFELVDDGDATHVAVADGPWGDPKTWDRKEVPGAGARAVVPKGKTVTVAATHDSERLDWLRVDGTLRFDPKADTSLKVITLVGNVGSRIEIGTQKDRVRADRTARVILGDRGERDKAMRQRDPYDLSGGLLSHGGVRIFGAEYTSHSTPTAVPKKGDSEVSFANAPTGWKVGDVLLFPGLDRQRMGNRSIDPWTGREMPKGEHQDEERQVRSVSKDGKTVTLDRALAYRHGGLYGFPGAVPVGNLSRNVVIESENPKQTGRRAHVMFMHTQDVIVDAALFRELGRTHVEGTLTSPEVKECEMVPGTDANTIGRYAVHFHVRWGATYQQEPFRVRNCAIVGSPKLGVVNHGGYGLVDGNVSYRVRGSHFFTENGSEIGRFTGNLAVRSDGTDGDDDGLPIPSDKGYKGHPLNIGHGGHGFWLQGGGVELDDDVAIGHSYSAFGFFVANNRIISFGGPAERNNPATKGTPFQRLDVFLAANLKDKKLAHGGKFVHTSAVPFRASRCVGLSCAVGLRVRGIDRTEFVVMHAVRDVVEDSQFVNNWRGYDLGYSPGQTHLKKVTFIGSDPGKGGFDSIGIGGGNHIPGYLRLEDVTVDGYRTGVVLPPRGVHSVEGGSITGIRKLVIGCPWGGKVTVSGVKFPTMKGEQAEPIIFGADPTGPWLYGVPPYSNWTRKFQAFEFVLDGKQIYHDDQKADAVPFDVKQKRWANYSYGPLHHGPLDGLTSRQLWQKYRLAIGGRPAPEKVTACPDVEGGWIGEAVAFDPVMESEPSTAYYGGKRYEALFGKATADDVPMHPRYYYDPIHVQTPRKGYVASVRVGGKEYRSEPTDLVSGVNLIPIEVGKQTRFLPVGSPNRGRDYKKDSK